MVTRVSDWIVVDGYCAARIIEGGDINKIADRVAFIEKTPRVRIRRYGTPFTDAREARDKDFLNWCEGHDWKAGGCSGDEDPAKLGAYGFNTQARAWCDRMLVMLGYQLRNRLYCEPEMIAASECTSASQSGDCAMRKK